MTCRNHRNTSTDQDPPIHPDYDENPLCDINTIIIAALAIAALVIGLLF